MSNGTDYKQELIEKLRENYLSVALGILVFLVAMTLIFRSGDGRDEITDEAATDETLQEEMTYVVQPGDSVSSIARDELGSMDYADEIIQLNNLTSPDQIEVGQELMLPSVQDDTMMKDTTEDAMTEDEADEAMMEKEQADDSGETTMEAEKTEQTISITGSSYTVRKGDHLWDIAERAYGDGNMYTTLIEANNLMNPDRLTEGMVLRIPRPSTK